MRITCLGWGEDSANASPGVGPAGLEKASLAERSIKYGGLSTIKFSDFCHKLCSLGMGHVQPVVTAGICAASNAAGLQSLVTPSWIEGFL